MKTPSLLTYSCLQLWCKAWVEGEIPPPPVFGKETMPKKAAFSL